MGKQIEPDDIREVFAQRGFKVTTEMQNGCHHLRADRNHLTPIATLVTHVGLLLLLLGGFLSGLYGWREKLTIGPDQPGLVRQYIACGIDVQDLSQIRR